MGPEILLLFPSPAVAILQGFPYLFSFFHFFGNKWNEKLLYLCPILFPKHPLLLLGSYAYADGEGNGTPLQYSCLKNPMDRGAW